MFFGLQTKEHDEFSAEAMTEFCQKRNTQMEWKFEREVVSEFLDGRDVISVHVTPNASDATPTFVAMLRLHAARSNRHAR